MLKAVFVDYTGTIMQEGGEDLQKVIMRVIRNSDEKDPKKVVALWWKLMKEFETASYGENYRTEDEIVDLLLKEYVERLHLDDDLGELHKLVQRFWMYAPAFDDTREFFEKCPLPIYIISNNGREYLEEGMRDKDLRPAGIVCGDMVRAYKPHRELFDKALEISGCRPEEVVHIGDSYLADVQGAVAAGIRPIFLDRKGGALDAADEKVCRVGSLLEALKVVSEGMR